MLIAIYSFAWVCDREGSLVLAWLKPLYVRSIDTISSRLYIAEAGHLAVLYQNLSGGKAVPLQYWNYILYIY